MICPHCGKETEVRKGVEKGGLSLLSESEEKDQSNKEEIKTPKSGVRGKAREYSQAFEIAWKAYGRKEQKFEAFAVWLVRAKEVGGEPQLLTLILGSLKWQAPAWAIEGWKFAPYFERYLKRRKWDDQPLPSARDARAAAPPPDNGARRTDEWLARKRAEVDPEKIPTADQLRALRGAR